MKVNIAISLLLVTCNLLISGERTFMFNPAGDARIIGRCIGDVFERAVTMHYVQALQKSLSTVDQSITVVLSRKPGETIPPLQNAHFANCLGVSLFVTFHFYQELDIISHIFVYTYKDGHSFMQLSDECALYPASYAYLYNQKKTYRYAESIVSSLQKHSANYSYCVHNPISAPMASLVGIIPPALMIEIGLKKNEDWVDYIQPMTHALMELCTTW